MKNILLLIVPFVFLFVGCEESKKQYTLTINVTPDGSGIVEPVESDIYEEGTIVTILSTPNVLIIFLCHHPELPRKLGRRVKTTNYTMCI